MTTNKQDELRSAYPIRTFRGVTQDELVELVNSEVSRVLSELEEHKNTAANVNLDLHGRRDCKSCSLVEDLEAFIKAKRKEYES